MAPHGGQAVSHHKIFKNRGETVADTLSYKILEQVKIAFYRRGLMNTGWDDKYEYTLLRPAEGHDFTYYKTFRELIQTHLTNNLRQPGDKMYLLFKDLVVEITKAEDVLPDSGLGKDLQNPNSYGLNLSQYCLKITFHNKHYGIPSRPVNTITMVTTVEHQVTFLLNNL